MSDGWIKVWRRLLSHPCLTQHDERGLWLTLLLRASHEPTEVRFRGKVVKLERGQLAISLREEAERGGTGHKRLRNIIELMKREGMLTLDTEKGTHFSILTICNYDSFQTEGAQPRARKGHSRGTVGAQSGHTEQEGKKDSSYETPNGVSPEESSISFEDAFREFYAAYPRKVAPQKAAEKYRAALKRASHPEIMDGLRRAKLAWERKGTPAEYIPHAATWLHGGRWADDDFIAGNDSADPIGEADRMSKDIIREMSHVDEPDFAGTHSLVPDGPAPGVWDWPEGDGRALVVAERPLH